MSSRFSGRHALTLGLALGLAVLSGEAQAQTTLLKQHIAALQSILARQ